MGCLDLRSIAPQVRETQVIRHDQNDVGALGLTGENGSKQQWESFKQIHLTLFTFLNFGLRGERRRAKLACRCEGFFGTENSAFERGAPTIPAREQAISRRGAEGIRGVSIRKCDAFLCESVQIRSLELGIGVQQREVPITLIIRVD